ncbi:hypothetical protein apy_16610 [Aeropyrum pernix]|uniref:Uncharacterized protein n=1 Tax=Aeropyrum pernix TaxID=56636 RepID=A0A401HBW5_AERPX|nr:hypothetical protein apy_16610 [Aeropyrum pernix]
MDDNREWWQKVDVSKLSGDARYRILRYVVDKYGRKRVLEETGLSRVTLWRLIEGKSPVRPEYIEPLLKLLTQEEFENIPNIIDTLGRIHKITSTLISLSRQD